MSSKMKAAVEKAGEELVEAAANAAVDVAKDAMKDGVKAAKEIVEEAIDDGKKIVIATMEKEAETIVYAIKDEEIIEAKPVNVAVKGGINIEVSEIVIDESKIPPHIAAEIAARTSAASSRPSILACEDGTATTQEVAPN